MYDTLLFWGMMLALFAIGFWLAFPRTSAMLGGMIWDWMQGKPVRGQPVQTPPQPIPPVAETPRPRLPEMRVGDVFVAREDVMPPHLWIGFGAGTRFRVARLFLGTDAMLGEESVILQAEKTGFLFRFSAAALRQDGSFIKVPTSYHFRVSGEAVELRNSRDLEKLLAGKPLVGVGMDGQPVEVRPSRAASSRKPRPKPAMKKRR